MHDVTYINYKTIQIQLSINERIHKTDILGAFNDRH